VIVDGQAVRVRDGDTVLVAMRRAGLHLTNGGCLCLAGDCPHCLAAIDHVAYRRTCQVQARDSMVVESHPARGRLPPLESRGVRPSGTTRHMHCDVVVIGQGKAGQAAAREAGASGLEVLTLDTVDGQDVIGIYPGPLVVARTDRGTLHVRPRVEVVVATGAMEIQPAVPGNDLRGLVTRRATTRLARAGVDLGRVVAIGPPPDDVPSARAQGALVKCEPRSDDPSRLGAVVMRREDGTEARVACDTASIALGLTPRDAILRLGRGMPVRGVGEVMGPATIPGPPIAGTVCPCLGVTVDDLSSVYARGFRDLELVKRATLAGTGPCQGAVCVPHLRGFLAHRGTPLQSPFTARPVTRALTLGEAASGAQHQATPRTGLDAEHRRLGARMDRLGGWWRPWTYGDDAAEYAAVREAVSICDVGTLGKLQVSGPDAVRLLEYLYPTRIATLAPGRLRYAVLLNERGYVIDDGLVGRESETRFTLTFTTGGATQAELWVRDWAEALAADVRILNRTWSQGAINVTGPRAKILLGRAGVVNPPDYLHHRVDEVAGVRCHIFRLSFTGEVSFELHHPVTESVALWRRLLDLGGDLGIRPHGLETLMRLRLEKGHVIVGQDTDFDSTPRRLGLDWAVRLDKPDFVGRQAIARTNRLPLDRQLVGLEIPDHTPPEGALVWMRTTYAGYVTSSTWSPALGKAVMLGWVRTSDGALPDEVTIDGRRARRVAAPFYDPEGVRARA
jgi:glycine cleavage system aminomethyltransferase T